MSRGPNLMVGRKLSALFNIEPGEGRPVLLMLAVSFLIGGSTALTSTAAYALFMAQFGAERLPYVYMAMSLVVSACTMAYLRLSDRLPLPRLLAVGVSSILFLLAGTRLGLSLSAALWLTFALPIASELVISLSLFAFWGLAGRLFSLRQGKRLFGLIGGGWDLARAVGGFLIPVLVLWLGTPNLLLVAVVGVACALPLILHLARSCATPLSTPAAEGAPAAGLPPRRVWWRNRYVLLVLGLYGALILAWSTLDVVFYGQADLNFAGEDRLASFLGLFLGMIGLFNLLGRSFLTAPVLRRFGIRGGLLLAPSVLFATGLLAAGVGTAFGIVAAYFWLVAAMRLLLDVLANSVDFPVLNVLYQPLPAAQRLKIQALVDGVAYSVSVGLSGVGLWALTTIWSLGPVHLSFVVLLLILVWAAVAFLLGREYPSKLRQALAKRRLGPVRLAPVDGATHAALEHELSSPSPGVVSYALTLLEAEGREHVASRLPALLDHPAPEVRVDVLQRMGRLGMAGSAPAVRERLALDPSPDVRGAALRALCALEGTAAYEYAVSYLDDPLPEIRQAAMVGLLRHGGIQGVLAAGNRLLQMAASATACDRVEAARLLGEIGAESFYQPLLPLLQDENLEVRTTALRAAGRLKSEWLWPMVVEGLGSSHLCGSATSALVAGGDAVLPTLFAAFAETSTQPRLQRRLVSVIGRIGGIQAVTWLKDRLAHPDPGIRTRILHALCRCGYQAAVGDVPQVVEHVKAEGALSAGILTMQNDIGSDASLELLQGALSHFLAEGQARIFSLLSFLYDRPSILQARDNLSLASTDRRAYALEVLDVLIASDQKKWLFPLLSDSPIDERGRQMRVLFPQPTVSRQERLEEIIANSSGQFSTWLQACALYAVAASPATAPVEVITGAATTQQHLVRETALWAMARLGKNRSGIQRDRWRPTPSQGLAGAAHGEEADDGERNMLTTIERVIALKRAPVFAEVPDEILAELAACLVEVEYGAGQTIFREGDLGDSLYIIADGGVRIHNTERTLDDLRTGAVFGEMAVLDGEPRSASASAGVDTLLLRLDRDALYEVMEDQIQVARGIIGVLCRRLRERLSDLSQSRSELER